MLPLCLQLDLNGDGNIDLWELCCFLISRRDEVVNAFDDNFFVEEAFASVLAADKDGRVSVEELRRVFMMTDAEALRGVGEAAFELLLSELGVANAPPGTTVSLEVLTRHPAFSDSPKEVAH